MISVSDIAKVQRPEPAGFAKDGRPENPRPYPPGKELAHPGNAALAHAGNANLAR